MKKLLGITIFLSVVVAIAGTISDLNFLSDRFMKEAVTITAASEGKRHIASDYEYNNLKMYFPVNQENSNKIDGMWTITKYTHDFSEGEKMTIAVELELIGNGLVEMRVKVEKEELSYTFLMKNIDENGTLIIMNELGHNDEETIDLVREVKIEKREEEIEEAVFESDEITQNNDSIDLVVISVQNPTKDKLAKVSSEITGTITVVDGQIEDLSVVVDGISISLDEEINLKTAGIFNTTYEGQHVSARYTKINEESVKVRFFSGPLAGNIIFFGTEEERENKIEEAFNIQSEAEERVSRFEGEQFYERDSDQMRIVASTEPEMEEKVEQTGFDFTQNYE